MSNEKPQMTSPPSIQPVTSTRRPCWACGYDMRGTTTGRCPECGESGITPLVFLDPQEFVVARVALERDKVVKFVQEPGGSLGPWGQLHNFGTTASVLWVSVSELTRIDKLLLEAGVMSSIGALPIIDRSEPACSRCGQHLDPHGPAICMACGLKFEWVEIGSQVADTINVLCACGCDLTDARDGHCPDCGAEIRRESAEPAVVGAPADGAPTAHQREATVQNFGSFVTVAAVLVGVLLGAKAAGHAFEDDYERALLYGIGCFVVWSLALVSVLLMRKTPSNNRKHR